MVVIGLLKPDDAFCHEAEVPLMAVKTCPTVGAVAAETTTVVVAEIKPFAAVASAAVPVVSAALFGISPETSARNAGAPLPLVGPANTKNCDVLPVFVPPRAMARVPDVMMAAPRFGILAAMIPAMPPVPPYVSVVPSSVRIESDETAVPLPE